MPRTLTSGSFAHTSKRSVSDCLYSFIAFVVRTLKLRSLKTWTFFLSAARAQCKTCSRWLPKCILVANNAVFGSDILVWVMLIFSHLTKFRDFSFGQKLSRLTRKHFDKFTSEISPSYENCRKSYLTFFIWNEKFPRVPRSRLLIGEISAGGKIFAPYEHNLFNTFPLSGKPVPYEQQKIIWRVEIFLANQNNFFPYEPYAP